MKMAIQMAYEAGKQGEAPFGCILIFQDQLVASSGDKSIAYSDPSAHAELTLISEYCQANQCIELKGHTLYCTVEPCMMCCGAIHWARIDRVVFSVSQDQLKAFSKGKTKPTADDLLNHDRQRVEVIGGILEAKGLEIWKTFGFASKKVLHQMRYPKKSLK